MLSSVDLCDNKLLLLDFSIQTISDQLTLLAISYTNEYSFDQTMFHNVSEFNILLSKATFLHYNLNAKLILMVAQAAGLW